MQPTKKKDSNKIRYISILLILNLFCIMAADDPKSLNMLTKLTTTKTIDIIPNSLADKYLENKTIPNNWHDIFVIWKRDTHLTLCNIPISNNLNITQVITRINKNSHLIRPNSMHHGNAYRFFCCYIRYLFC